MFTRTITTEELTRLYQARIEADRRYNEALTALDAAAPKAVDAPHPPPPPDEHQITPINQRWNVLSIAPPPLAGWRGRAAAFVWTLVEPYFERQKAFNAAVVDHLNRSLVVDHATRQSIESTIAMLRDQMNAVRTFDSHLIMYLQQVTPYVDSKDYEFNGLLRRINEDAAEYADILDHRVIAVGGGLSGLGDEVQKRMESLAARERRFEARAAALSAAHDDLRSAVSVLDNATRVLKREVERLMTRTESGGLAREAAATAPADQQSPEAVPARAASHGASPGALDSYKYVGFEDQFRGSQADIRARLSEYLPYFEGASDVLDIGCGRGELLDLLRERGVSARGLDLNHEMVEICQARGLRVDEGDALTLLESMRDGELGGLFAAQVVEHLQPDYLLRLLDVAFHKMRPGACLILETINPACWFAFFESYIRDITHVRPLHPDTLQYLVRASGFQRVTVRYRAPYPEHDRLQPAPLSASSLRGDAGAQAGASAAAAAAAADLVDTFNANVEKLNRLIFTHLDYAIIATR